MAVLWTFVAKPKNRKVLGWIGGGMVTVASGAWVVVTYVWPAQDDAKIVCAQQGSIASGRDASGNTINYNGGAPAHYTGGALSGTGNGATSCSETGKK